MELVSDTIVCAVLVFPVADDRVCLPRKKKKIGKGKRNGYGGGLHPNENHFQAAIRELREEAKISVEEQHLTFAAVCNFHNQLPDGSSCLCIVTVFLLTQWSGQLTETEEMGEPEWFPVNSLPLHDLMPADQHWLPRVLKGERLLVKTTYSPHQQEVRGQVCVRPLPTSDLLQEQAELSER